MKIYAVRHGQTDSNNKRLLMGQRFDESLNSTGIKQAEETSKILKEVDFDIIFSSPQKRAKETAEIINRLFNLPVILRDGLKERDFGSLSGKSWDDMGKVVGANQRNIDRSQKYDYRPYGGESMEDVKSRVLKFIDEIKTNHNDRNVLVVAHGGMMKMFHHLYGDKEKEFRTRNAEIHEFNI